MANMTQFGDKTPGVVIFKSESHKLHQAFPVKKGEKVIKGQPVVINTDGTIQGFKAGDVLSKIIGWAVTDSEFPAYQESKQHGPVDVTIMVSGYAIVYGVSKGALDAVPVKPTGSLDSTKRFAEYEATAEATESTPADRIVAVNLTPATAAGELIQILIL
ncbi:MAG: hypothetical protein RSC49_03500 [Clostridium sp.]